MTPTYTLPQRTPDPTLPPLDPDAPRRAILVRVEVAADFERRLDNQWMVEREIHADRWSWDWAPEAAETAQDSDSLTETLIRSNPIIPEAPQWHNRPLWCVTGPTCQPSVFCCALRHHGPQWGLCIWGYSVWAGEPGFRTLGQRLDEWAAKEQERWDYAPRFYATQQAALTEVVRLITPECSVPWAPAKEDAA